MQNQWNTEDAARFPGDLGQCVYASRLLGADPALVLHGGGNTSVKIAQTNIFGEPETVLYVKGSGSDLATVEAKGFAPVRLDHLRRLTTLETLSDTEWLNELRGSAINAAAPPASVEAMLHALLPAKYVLHSHADAVLAITNTPGGAERIRTIYGDDVVIVPYERPGFPLAKRCAALFAAELSARTAGVVLLRHGLFSFGETAEAAYASMIDLVSRAEAYLAAYPVPAAPVTLPDPQRPLRQELASLRRALSDAAGAPLILTTHDDEPCLRFAQRADVGMISQQGPATPDHVIRTKRAPMIGRDVTAFRAAYESFFQEQQARTGRQLTMLDPAPRVVLDPDLGMVAVGRSAQDAVIAGDIYRHTMAIIAQASALEAYQAQPAADIFDAEYWELEQAKLTLQGRTPMFAGEIGLVTGAASGIGKACVESLLARGAAVVGLDINPAIEQLFDRPDFLGVRCDVTSEEQLIAALERTARAFGGLDMLILNAGIFPPSRRIADMPTAEWRRTMTINLDANMILMREAHALLKHAPRRGRVAIIGSKNVPAPGPGAVAYSASKAALNQLARVAALEWGQDGIRINSLHPNAVFDTGLWTDEVLQARAKHYGLTVEQYKTNNVMQIEVTSRDVAELAAEMCGPLFAKTTASQVPVDGGNERVI
ncbi:bifunctional aldolase/short-chain dehydrogenase [Oscillochloris sp. ZM17-4]|uniref:bifunctional aldolase/short-chain dehydrogenase n=1 Tax=Oscillochloris sp. ZM17-4 TaxID=2866714 RepID=UPI001C72BCAE|nr:bifunctional aldolase/short-chain dehydrogenase [Oscillochloris sp. ZM17-4]MBX0327020.1 bifunctional aldolase/short-chain dehydrogenase [Oscillochloris sp. ZM17-4]